MERRSTLLISVLTLMLIFSACALSSGAAPQSVKSIETKGIAEKCLACHGSYDKIAEATKDFKASSGETVTPHQYVPHGEKKVIPDCTECHTPHPVPLEDKSKVVKPDSVAWCYSTCHHAYNLQPCKNCH